MPDSRILTIMLFSKQFLTVAKVKDEREEKSLIREGESYILQNLL